MMRFSGTFGWLTATIILATQTAGCDLSNEKTGTSQISGDLRVLRRGNGGEPQSLDPALAEDVHAFNVLADLYEGLVAESADGTPQPGVARHWDVSADGRRYTFYLRDDAIWSNGDPLTANEFVMAFHRVVSPDTFSPYAFLLEPIRNYQAVATGDLPADSLGVYARDERTLLIELETPAPYFPGILAMPVTYPVHIAVDDSTGRLSNPETFVGNGPFVLDQWLVGDRIRLRKNPRFRDSGSVDIDVVEYFPIAEPAMEFNMFRAGELEITATVPPEAIAGLRESGSTELRITPSLGLYYLAFDLTEPPFDNADLRRALTMAIDREVLVSVLGRGEQGAYGIVPPGVSNYQGARFDWANLAAPAREALARDAFSQAGYGDAEQLQMTLTYDAGDIHETVALAVSSMWHDVLGIEVALEKKEWKLFLATRDDRAAWQAMRFAWTGDYNDASTFLDIFHSASQQNLAKYQSQAYDKLLDEAARVAEPALRTDRQNAAEALLLEDHPIAPLYFYVSKHLVSSRVHGFQDNVLDRHPSRHLQLRQVD